VFVAAAGVYLLTAQRGPSWQDSGIFQWRIHTFDLTGWLGLALAHPLLIVLGKLGAMVPLGEEAFRVNALSAIAGAVAAANLAVLVRRLTPKTPTAAYFSAAAFTLAHTVWWLSTVTESHAVLAAITSGELLVLVSLVRRPRVSMLLLLGLLNGLGVCTHNLALLALPAYGLTVVALAVKGKLRRLSVPLFVLSWCAGASLLLTLVIRQAAEIGFGSAVHSALFGKHWQGDVMGGSLRAFALGLGYIVYNFPNFALPLAAVGLWRLARRVGKPLAAALGYILAVHFVFAVRYTVPDQFMFFVPFYLMVSALAGVGLAELSDMRRSWLPVAAWATLALGPIAYAAAPAAVPALKVALPGAARELPFRNHARYWLTPWKHDENSAERFATAALAQLKRQTGQAILIADSTTLSPLRWIAEIEGAPERIRLTDRSDSKLLGPLEQDPEQFWEGVRQQGTSLFVISNEPGYCPEALRPYVEPERTGVLYRVNPPPRPDAPTHPAGGPASAPAAARE